MKDSGNSKAEDDSAWSRFSRSAESWMPELVAGIALFGSLILVCLAVVFGGWWWLGAAFVLLLVVTSFLLEIRSHLSKLRHLLNELEGLPEFQNAFFLLRHAAREALNVLGLLLILVVMVFLCIGGFLAFYFWPLDRFQ